ncbi:MAG: hypothetical protein A2033_02640 [Bacteroidetes bacterium GWA2_31_9]|nr:MAG: hypothetical protein A2033_02640 [Bacteroidetes bacterium GWA2_31_9]
MKDLNPFPVADYVSLDCFCNRENESERIISAIENGRNITLLSIRRLGKTGLIKHIFYKLNKNTKYRLLYIDILPTNNLNDFIKALSDAIIKDEQKKSGNYLKKIAKLISGIKANLTFDEFTGIPKLEFDYKNTNDAINSLSQIFSYLASQKEKYIIAIDEFQQIISYPEKNIEALLRTNIQHQHKDNFIFSGSNKHLLTSIFSDYGRPFYQSADFLELNRLEISEYAQFIKNHLNKRKQNIDIDLIKNIIQYLDCHTFYVQYFFNRLYELREKNINADTIEYLKQNILKEKEYIYYSYRNLITSSQFQLLEAIAKEKSVKETSSHEFIGKYKLKQASSVSRSLKALLDKELIYCENSEYKVYDVFFSKWLEKL